jgi:aminoglycoside 2''-phosphotransferase
VSFIGEGWCSSTFLVNEDLVVRFPKRNDWADRDREMRFLAFAEYRLPLRVPHYLHSAPSSPAAPNGYAIYNYIRGQALDVVGLTERQRSSAAEQIAEFLRALHRLQPDADVEVLLPREDERATVDQLAERAGREIMPLLSVSETQCLRDRFEAFLSDPENFASRQSVLHADLSREHLLAAGEKLTGVIDFGDVTQGDADYDFSYLFADYGAPFVEEVAARYGHKDPARLMFKVKYFELADQIDTILNGTGHALDGQQARAWSRLKELLR